MLEPELFLGLYYVCLERIGTTVLQSFGGGNQTSLNRCWLAVNLIPPALLLGFNYILYVIATSGTQFPGLFIYKMYSKLELATFISLS